MLYKQFYLNIFSNLKWKVTVLEEGCVNDDGCSRARLTWKISIKALALTVLSDIHRYVPFRLLLSAFNPSLVDGALHFIIPFGIHLS